MNRWGANAQARVNVNMRRRDTGIEGLKFGLNTNWQKGESLNTLIWDEAYDGLYGTTDGAATSTANLWARWTHTSNTSHRVEPSTASATAGSTSTTTTTTTKATRATCFTRNTNSSNAEKRGVWKGWC